MDSERIVAILRALADPTRLAIVRMLTHERLCNCNLGDALGLAPNLVSHHLKVLRESGLISAERHPTDARWVLYDLDRGALAAVVAALAAMAETLPLEACRCGPATRVDACLTPQGASAIP